MIKQFVIMYDSTMAVRMQAIRSASESVLPAFSPRAFAQSLQILVATLNNVFVLVDINFLLQEI